MVSAPAPKGVLKNSQAASRPQDGQDHGLIFIWLHGALSRLLFHGGFVLGTILFSGPVANTERPLPRPLSLVHALIESARNYGDFGWYGRVATRGYDAEPFSAATQRTWAFFPLHPLFIRMFEAGSLQFLVSQLAFFLTITLLYTYLSRNHSRSLAFNATLLFLYFPFSFSLSQFRPEAFLIFFSVLSLYLASCGRLWDSALAAAVAGLAKPNAFLLSILLLGHYPGIPRFEPRHPMESLKEIWRAAPSAFSWKGLVMLAAPAAGVVFMSLHLHNLTGDYLAWAKIQAAWGGKFGQGAWDGVHQLITQPMVVGRGGWDPTLLHWGVFAVFTVAVGSLLWRRMYLFALYAVLYTAMTFSNFGVIVLGKHLSTCFPVFVGISLLTRNRQVLMAMVIFGAALLSLNGLFNGMNLDFTRP